MGDFPVLQKGLAPGLVMLPAIADMVIVTSGNSVMGSWVQIVAATSEDYYLVGLETKYNGGANAVTYWNGQIGLGAAAAEVILTGFMVGAHASSQDNSDFKLLPTWFFVPSGSRIAARGAASSGRDARIGLWMLPVASIAEREY